MFDTGVGTCRGLSRWHIDGDQALASAEIESSHSPWRPPPPPLPAEPRSVPRGGAGLRQGGLITRSELLGCAQLSPSPKREGGPGNVLPGLALPPGFCAVAPQTRPNAPLLAGKQTHRSSSAVFTALGSHPAFLGLCVLTPAGGAAWARLAGVTGLRQEDVGGSRHAQCRRSAGNARQLVSSSLSLMACADPGHPK